MLPTPFPVACRRYASISLTVAAAITSHRPSPICTRNNHAAPQTLSLASRIQTNPDKASTLRNANLVKSCCPIASFKQRITGARGFMYGGQIRRSASRTIRVPLVVRSLSQQKKSEYACRPLGAEKPHLSPLQFPLLTKQCCRDSLLFVRPASYPYPLADLARIWRIRTIMYERNIEITRFSTAFSSLE